MTTPDSWFFIVGCQRSGTTLVRLVVECHSHVECADGQTSYRILAGRLAPEQRRPRLGLKVPAVTEQFDDAVMGDPIGVPAFDNPYRGQPLVFLVRHPLDVVASMRALRIGAGPWIEEYLLPVFRARQARDAPFAARYGSDLAAADRAAHPDLARAALYWRFKTEALRRYRARGFPVLSLRYEDLVTRPRAELERLGAGPDVPPHASAPAGRRRRVRDRWHAVGASDRRPVGGAVAPGVP